MALQHALLIRLLDDLDSKMLGIGIDQVVSFFVYLCRG